MHGHVHGVASQISNAGTQVAAARTTAAQEAAATRRKLQRAAAELAGTTTEDAVGLIDQWAGSGSHSGSQPSDDRTVPTWPARATAEPDPTPTGKAISYYV